MLMNGRCCLFHEKFDVSDRVSICALFNLVVEANLFFLFN